MYEADLNELSPMTRIPRAVLLREASTTCRRAAQDQGDESQQKEGSSHENDSTTAMLRPTSLRPVLRRAAPTRARKCTENPRVGGSIPPLATTFRLGYSASAASRRLS